MSSVGQLEPDIAVGSGWQVGIFYVTWFYRKTIIDRALESDSAPYMFTMRILFLMSSVAHLEAEIATGRWVFYKYI